MPKYTAHTPNSDELLNTILVFHSRNPITQVELDTETYHEYTNAEGKRRYWIEKPITASAFAPMPPMLTLINTNGDAFHFELTEDNAREITDLACDVMQGM